VSSEQTKTVYRLDGVEYEDVEHIVTEENPDLALCGVDQTDVPWDQGFPPCQACVDVIDGRMN
jgi:hypothetical protein